MRDIDKRDLNCSDFFKDFAYEFNVFLIFEVSNSRLFRKTRDIPYLNKWVGHLFFVYVRNKYTRFYFYSRRISLSVKMRVTLDNLIQSIDIETFIDKTIL